ncbi:hypothetical protein DFH28DRAFT_1077544 [Melampsora americana]|nr:hypothetical protein DFH28DRAFT_1077544 [Melampsora americana]
MFRDVVKIGFIMDQSIANFATNSSEIKKGIDIVKGLIPNVLKTQDELYKSIKLSDVNQDKEIKKAMYEAKPSGEALIKALDTIAASPEDANLIKANYKAMGEAIGKIIDVSEKLAEAADPAPAPKLDGDRIVPQLKNHDSNDAEKEMNSGEKPSEKKDQSPRGEVIEVGKSSEDQLPQAADIPSLPTATEPDPVPISGEKSTQLAKSDDHHSVASAEKLAQPLAVSATSSKDEVGAAVDKVSQV